MQHRSESLHCPCRTNADPEIVQDATYKVESACRRHAEDRDRAVREDSKGFEGLTAFGQENVDAIVKSSEIAAKAAEGIGSEISAYSKKAFEDGVAAAQDLGRREDHDRAVREADRLRAVAFEGFVSQTTKMNEIVVRRCQGYRRARSAPALPPPPSG